MTISKDCAHEACECKARKASQFCSPACEKSAGQAQAGCGCGHDGCHAEPVDAEASIDGNQGEGNREADRRYREGAADFAKSGRVREAAREAAESVDKSGSARPKPR